MNSRVALTDSRVAQDGRAVALDAWWSAQSLRVLNRPPYLPYPPHLPLLPPRSLQPLVIFLTFRAELVDEFSVGLDALVEQDSERLGVHLRIVDRQRDFHRAEVLAMELFGHLRRVAHRAAPRVGPQIVAEPARLDHERVALPVSD